MSKHLRILRTSWALENTESRLRKQHSDQEFLPAALEIIETPPSPGLRWLLLSLCGLFAIALAWSCIGQVDIVVVATGKVIPSSNTKIIQPMDIGGVHAIYVRDGQAVRAGQLLIELDPTLTGADQAQAQQGLHTAEATRARNAALLGYLGGGPGTVTAAHGTPPSMLQTQQHLARSQIAEFEGQRAGLMGNKAEHAAELASALSEVAKLRATLPLVEQQLSARRELSDLGSFSKLKMLEYQQQFIEHGYNITVQMSNAEKARAAIANTDAQLAALHGTFGKNAAIELAKAEDDVNLRSEELRKTGRKRDLQQIRAPVDGTVQQLAVHTIGGVVQPAQALLVIVPDGSEVEVEAQILNKDVGFVRAGQTARVKLEAYPFTTYGLIDGTVASVSRDSMDPPAKERDPAAAAKAPAVGQIYSARITLAQSTIKVGATTEPIGPGLAVQAEIKTGTRRIIEYLLSPIAKTMDEAGRER